MSKRRKVLAYLFGSLGDSIVAIPAMRALRRHFPDAEIVVLQNSDVNVPVNASDVLPSELVDRFISYTNLTGRLNKLFGFIKLRSQIKKESFDAAAYLVVTERPTDSIIRDRKFFSYCGIRELYGFNWFTQQDLYPVSDSGRPLLTTNEAIRKLERFEKDGIQIDLKSDLRTPLIDLSAEEISAAQKWLDEHRQFAGRPIIGINPGSKTLVNRWDLKNFIELGKKIDKLEQYEILIVGGGQETKMGTEMAANGVKCINAAGLFSVRASAALLSHCYAFIGLDTGTTHLASAVGTPCFAIYGERNNPGQWFPVGPNNMIVRHEVPCAGCRVFKCPVPGHPCMNDIEPDSVWRQLQPFLQDGGTNIIDSPKLVSI